jgi:hypothetical protein
VFPNVHVELIDFSPNADDRVYYYVTVILEVNAANMDGEVGICYRRQSDGPLSALDVPMWLRPWLSTLLILRSFVPLVQQRRMQLLSTIAARFTLRKYLG